MNISKKNTPFFSVIIPTYNRGERLIEAVKSLLAQEFTDFEVIIVDDGSTDNTNLLLGTLISTCSNIRYYYKENEERSIARNFGIEKAYGRYIGFLDSDDKAYPNHLSVAHNLLRRNSFPEIGHLGYKFIDENGVTIATRDDFDNTFREKLIIENILHGNAIFVRSDIIKKINFIPSRKAIISEDWYVWLRLAARYQFHFDNTITSTVVNHSGRSLSNIDSEKLIASTEIIIECLKKDSVLLDAYGDKIKGHIANHYTFVSLMLSLTKDHRIKTLKYLLKAIKHDPSVLFRKRFLATLKHFA